MKFTLWYFIKMKPLPPSTLGLLVAAASIFSLGFAYTSQYGFGLQPCELCLYQRPIYFMTIALGVFAALASRTYGLTSRRREDLGPSARQERVRSADNRAKVSKIPSALLWICTLLLLGESGIALFQVGVEQHWWAGLTSCSGSGGNIAAMTAADILKQIESAAVVRCDEVQFQIFGLSMAALNGLWAFALAAGLAVNLIRLKR